jgi:hypothetical protein
VPVSLPSLVLSGVLLAGLLTAAGPAPASAGLLDPADPRVAPAGRGGPPVPFPQNPQGLPAQADWGPQIEDFAGYQPQHACAATALRGTIALRNLVLRTYGPGSDAGAIRSCAVGGQSEHKEGRAWDWAVNVGDPQERRVAADFLAWLTARDGAMARRLGVMYVIYNRKIWSGWRDGWENYTGYSPHTDHVHISLSWNGARGHTSFWTGRVWRTDVGTCTYFANQPAVVATRKPRTNPCPAPAPTPRGSTQPTAWLGGGGGHVATARRLLGLPAGTVLDRPTRLRILKWQARHDLPRTGALDKPTWASLQPSTRQLYVPRWTPAEAASWGRAQGSPVLHPASAGTAVYALQTALRMPSRLRTGFLGSRTKTALVAFRRNHGLGTDPSTNDAVWAELPR